MNSHHVWNVWLFYSNVTSDHLERWTSNNNSAVVIYLFCGETKIINVINLTITLACMKMDLQQIKMSSNNQFPSALHHKFLTSVLTQTHNTNKHFLQSLIWYVDVKASEIFRNFSLYIFSYNSIVSIKQYSNKQKWDKHVVNNNF